MDLVAHQVIDRFFIKRCNKCQKFGHYQKDCKSEPHCGFCRQSHLSTHCDQVEEGDVDHYHCINCERDGKISVGHSAYWHKCPTYLTAEENEEINTILQSKQIGNKKFVNVFM